MRIARLLPILLLAECAAALPPAQVAHSVTIEFRTNRPGSDYRDFDLDTAEPEACRVACLREAQCRAFSFRPKMAGPYFKTNHCWLKNAVPPPVFNVHFTSGVKRVGIGM